MSLESRTAPRRQLLVLSTLALLAGGVLILSKSTRPGEAGLPVSAESGRASDTSRSPRGAQLRETPATPDTGARAADTPAADEPRRLICRERASGEPLPGVRLYRDAESVSEASDDRGVLELAADTRGGFVLWSSGWLPVEVRAEALPGEVLFDRAQASLEVRLLNATSEHKLLRSLLQPIAAGPRSDGPWRPTLEERALDVFSAERVLPGSYDLYLWIIQPDGEPRGYSRKAIEVATRGTTRISIDVDIPVDPDELESDS